MWQDYGDGLKREEKFEIQLIVVTLKPTQEN
jgi:hypothetical protein